MPGIRPLSAFSGFSFLATCAQPVVPSQSSFPQPESIACSDFPCEHMAQVGSLKRARVTLEKPFNFSSTCCTKNFSLISCSTMSKRTQDQKEEERAVSKSRPAAMNISSFIATSSSTASSPIASKSLGMPIASGKPDCRMSIEPSSFDAASTSQVRPRMHTSAGEWKGSGETRRIKKKKIQKTPTILRLRLGTANKNLCCPKL